jgi:hypothetical protein
MNLTELQNKLLAAARRNPPDGQVPYAFEKRIMARLTAMPKPSEWLAWSRALWFGAAACVAVAVLTSVLPVQVADDDDDSFSEGVEQSIMASVDDFENVQ